jgi:hypothetical protein
MAREKFVKIAPDECACGAETVLSTVCTTEFLGDFQPWQLSNFKPSCIRVNKKKHKVPPPAQQAGQVSG